MFECWLPVLICLALSVIYVASLYIWDSSKGRDHPSTIKKRCISVAIMTVVSPLFVKFSLSQDSLQQFGYSSTDFNLWEVMGVRWAGLFNAILYPLMLTVIFYTGPIIHWFTHYYNSIYLDPRVLYHIISHPVWLRNHLIAPFSEEWTFRACLLPILLQCLSPFTALFVAPLFFGLAHFHHAVERIRLGLPVGVVIFSSLFQCLFTSVFGFYSAFLFMKTGHFISSFITHSFCNLMGLPAVSAILTLPLKSRCFHLTFHVVGIVFWYFLLPRLTDGCLFSPVINYLPDL